MQSRSIRAMPKAQVRPAQGDIHRNPVMCVALTATIAATFWLGLIWFAQRLY